MGRGLVVIGLLLAGCSEEAAEAPPDWAGTWVASTDRAAWIQPDPETCELPSALTGTWSFPFDVVELADGRAAVLERSFSSGLLIRVGEATSDGLSATTRVDRTYESGSVFTDRFEMSAEVADGTLVGSFSTIEERHDSDGELTRSCITEIPFAATRSRVPERLEADAEVPVGGPWMGIFDAAKTQEGPTCNLDPAYSGTYIELFDVTALEDGTAAIIWDAESALVGTWTDGSVTVHRERTASAGLDPDLLVATSTLDLELAIAGDAGTGTYAVRETEGYASEPEPFEDCAQTRSLDLVRVVTSL